MKIEVRVKIVAENDKHVDATKEEIERTAKQVWKKDMELLSEAIGAKSITVTSCKLLEE